MGQDFKTQILAALGKIGKVPVGNAMINHFLESVTIEINFDNELTSFPRSKLLEIIDPGEQMDKYDPETSEIRFVKLPKMQKFIQKLNYWFLRKLALKYQ